MVSNLIKKYDLKFGNEELRMKKRNVYCITEEGLPVITRIGLDGFYELLGLFTTGLTNEEISSLSVVSRKESLRYRRNRTFSRLSAYDRDNYLLPQYYPDMENLDVSAVENDRYARSKETVSDILPDYHINLCDILPEFSQEDK